MGKPFKLELLDLPKTLEWAQLAPIEDIAAFAATSTSLLTVGSGGAFTAAHFASTVHEASGNLSRPLTPLHIASSPLDLSGTSVLLFSAGGGNVDIVNAFRGIAKREPRQLLAICLKSDTRLAAEAKQLGIGRCMEYRLPVGSDGFLAVNSLAAFCILIGRAFGASTPSEPSLFPPTDFLSSAVDQPALPPSDTLVVLHGFWGATAAIDLESKCIEAGLVNVQLADFRSFAHGRHHWLAKHPNSHVIALVTTSDEALARRTLSLIPSEITRRVIKTPLQGAAAGIHLLIQVFYLVQQIGQLRGIDPGRPGVPEFGRRLYNLSPGQVRINTPIPNDAATPIERKTGKDIRTLSQDDQASWLKAFRTFTSKLRRTSFQGIIFDYDGTLVDSEHRFGDLPTAISDSLITLLEANVHVGIATGRGKSARLAIERSIPEKFWGKVLIAYYNGAEIGRVSDAIIPNVHAPKNAAIVTLEDILITAPMFKELATFEVRPQQITISPQWLNAWPRTRDVVLDLLAKSGLFRTLQLVESSHSLDVIPLEVSKLSLKSFFATCIPSPANRAPSILCIGDRGAWPGNDHALLSSEYSLSVDSVSPDPNSCWNLAHPGFRGMRATLQYLSWLEMESSGFRFEFSKRNLK